MSVITLQVGQCGNQVGRALFDALAAEAEAKDNNYSYGVLTSFFKEGSKSSRLCARTVLVDTEPKVLADTLAGSKASRAWWSYGDSHTLLDCSGSGNNWARGFSYCSMQKADPVMDLLRREVEAADRLGGFLVMQSVAGGTGAGLGTGLTQALRDAYPLASILNHCIWPYEAGEIIVQSYNSVLTLSHLVRVSDGLLLVQNDALRDTCRASLNQPRPSTEDMNAVAAASLSSILLPSYARSEAGSHSLMRALHLGDVLEATAGHPAYRLLTLRSLPALPSHGPASPFSSASWQPLLSRLYRMFTTGCPTERQAQVGLSGLSEGGTPQYTLGAPRRGNRAAGAMLVLRGGGAASAPVHPFSAAQPREVWGYGPLSLACQESGFGNAKLAASLLSSDKACVRPVTWAVRQASQLLATGAYVHQYQAFGLERDDLTRSIARTEEVIARYTSL